MMVRGCCGAGGHKFSMSVPHSASFNRLKLKQGIFSLSVKKNLCNCKGSETLD